MNRFCIRLDIAKERIHDNKQTIKNYQESKETDKEMKVQHRETENIVNRGQVRENEIKALIKGILNPQN